MAEPKSIYGNGDQGNKYVQPSKQLEDLELVRAHGQIELENIIFIIASPSAQTLWWWQNPNLSIRMESKEISMFNLPSNWSKRNW